MAHTSVVYVIFIFVMLILVPISASSPSSGISTQDFHSIGDVNGEVLVNSDYNIRSKRQKHRYKSHVSWINGIAHTPSDAKETAERMSSLFGGETIHYCHNPTSMTKPSDTLGYVRDLTQCTQQLRFGKETQEVLDLTNHLRELCRKTGRYGRVLHLAHSQGALITYLAAKKLTEEERRKIEIVCFGGAAAITVEEVRDGGKGVGGVVGGGVDLEGIRGEGVRAGGQGVEVCVNTPPPPSSPPTVPRVQPVRKLLLCKRPPPPHSRPV